MTANDSEGKRRLNRALISSIGLLVALAIVVTLARPSIPSEMLPTGTAIITPSASATEPILSGQSQGLATLRAWGTMTAQAPTWTPRPTQTPGPSPTPTITPTPEVPETRLEFLPDPYQGPLPEGAKAVLGLGHILSWEVSPDGAYLAVITGTNLLTVYAIATWEPIWFDTPDISDSYSELRWSPDGSKISIRTNFAISVWDAQTGRRLFVVDLFDFYTWESVYLEHWWRSAEWSPDGMTLALGSDDIFLINTDTGKVDQELLVLVEVEASHGAGRLVWSADGTKLGARVEEGMSSRTVVWNVATAEIIQTIDGEGPVAWSPDLKVVVTGTSSRYTVWNTESAKKLATSDSKPAISPDGTKVAINDGDVTHILDTRTGATLQTLERDSPAQEFLSWSPDSTMLVAASVDTGKVWDTRTGQVLFFLPDLAPDSVETPSYPWVMLKWSSDSKRLITGSNADFGITVWNVETGKPTRVLLNDGVAQFFPDSNTLLLLDDGIDLTLWNSETGEVLHQVAGTWAGEIAWSEDSSKVALITRPWALIWDAANGTFLEKLSNSDLIDFIRDDEKLADNTSPDGSRTATTEWLDSGMAIMLQDSVTNEVIRQILFPGLFCEGFCLHYVWSPDSRWLAISDYGSLYIHRADTGARVSVKSSPGMIEAFSFSPDGKLIAAVVGGAVIVWQVP